jgi:arylsulfatase A-like enzyme
VTTTPPVARRPAGRPNVLLIFCDQLRPDALGSLGTQAPLRTPVQDELAAGAVRFAHAYTPNPVCVPAREAVLTGRWGHRFGCTDNGDPRAGAGVPTFPRLLHEAGYVTFAVGKQHFHPVRAHRGYGRLLLSEGQPAHRQDDDYLLYLRDRGYGHVAAPGGPRGTLYYAPRESPLPPELHITRWTAEQCAALIRANRNRPFLATAAFFKPHPPFDPPRLYWDRYPPRSVSLPPPGAPAPGPAPLPPPGAGPEPDDFLRVQNHSKTMLAPDEARVRAVRSAYYALVEQLDDAIGLLLQTLRDCALLDHTLVIVSADHGELLGDHGAWGKRSFYEGAGAVPLLLHWPDGLPPATVRRTPVSTIDLFATIAGAAGVAPPGPLDGLDLLPLAREGAAPERPGVGAEFGRDRTRKLMWRWEEGGSQWKYVWLANGGRQQLFDLAADPLELRDLAAEEGRRCEEAHRRLAAWCRVTDFPGALASGGERLAEYPFEALPLGQVRGGPPAWPARDPDFRA